MATNQNKYQTIFADLRAKIWSGYYPANQQLPSENELAQQYQVSRITSKRALQELADIGLVQRRQGSGTFVRRGLRLRAKTGQILLVIPFAPESGLGDYITGIKEVLTPKQEELTVIENQSFDFDHPQAFADKYDGIIYYPQDLAAELVQLQKFALAHIPLVLIDQTAAGLPIPSVVADNTQGGYLATQTLIENGHERIIFLATARFAHSLNSSVAQRYFGYLQALMEQDLTFAIAPEQATQLTENNFAALPDFIQAEQITGIVTEHDLLALDILDFLQAQGFKIPDDLSVIGFDNITRTATSRPQLSTIRQDFQTIGRQAAQLLQQRIANPFDPEIKQATVPVNLIARQSIKKLNRN